ncbi:MAG: helix-turn-helix domain-containing protein [Defluviitaleaceae bacterium]|nr:helix-turn-helix domain-containing protein [Defluviitaleaceae bacterium]
MLKSIQKIKESLINEYLALKKLENQNMDKLINNIEKCLAKKADDDLTMILYDLKTTKADNDDKSFEECCATAAPIFKYLESLVEWKYLDFAVLASMIAFLPTFGSTMEFAEEAFALLNDEEYESQYEFRIVRAIMHHNLTHRLLRVKYHESNLSVEILNKAFKRSFDHIMAIAIRNKLPMQYVLQIRQGIFENKQELIKVGLEALAECGNRKLYRITKSDMAEYLAYMDETLDRPLEGILTGHQIRKRRIETDMLATDLADLMNIEPSALNAIERGEDSVSFNRLKNFAKILGVKLDYFTGDDDAIKENADPFLLAVNACTAKATEADKELMLNVLHSIMNTKYPDRGKLKEKPTD